MNDRHQTFIRKELCRTKEIDILAGLFSECCQEFRLERYPELCQLKGVLQEEAFHGEGDVYRHTEMVCQVLTEFPEWSVLSAGEREVLFSAAAYHDIGKKSCTRQEEGKILSPRHALVGEKIFRALVYRENRQFGLDFAQREQAAKLIRFHGLPLWFAEKQRPEAELLKAAESIPLRWLYLLAKADVLGRIADDREALAEQVEWFGEFARELGVWEKPHIFYNSYTKERFFSTEDLGKDAQLYDDRTFDIYLMSGLPLSGKDSWIAEKGGGLPVISLDRLREEMGVSPAKGSGRVALAALEQARGFLRKKQPFIWNATNIIRETRRKLTSLCAGYGARVHILYLEVPYRELLKRNSTRQRHIPEHVLEEMIGKLEVPAPWEAEEVRYLTTS